MIARTASVIREEIAALEAVRRARLLGKQKAEVGYEGNSVKFASVSLDAINGEIARLKIELSKVTGQPSGIGPIRFGFGDRY